MHLVLSIQSSSKLVCHEIFLSVSVAMGDLVDPFKYKLVKPNLRSHL